MTTTTTTKAPAKKAAAKRTSSTPKAAKKAAAKVASPQRTLAPEDVRKDLSRRLLACRAAGITRPKLSEYIGLKQSAIWRAEQGRAYASEVDAITAVITRVDSGDIKPPERTSGPSRTDLLHRLESADALLANPDGAKTAADLHKLVQRARDLLNIAAGA